MVRVKICGITNEGDLRAAVDAGADAVGFISGFPTSPRNLSFRRAETLISQTPPLVTSVLVTNAQTLKRSYDDVVRVAPNAIQLYGDIASMTGRLKRLNARIIRPVLVGSPDGQSLSRDLPESFDAVLTDTYKNGAFGGTGETSNWELCLRIREQISPLPLILSGGLKPANVGEAIRTVAPYAVDTSSGVEISPGRKDHQKLKDFVRIAKETR